jgi:hypothetical protein
MQWVLERMEEAKRQRMKGRREINEARSKER